MTKIYELKNVSKTYRNDGKEFEALKNISLDVEEGEIFGIIGMSGAGKSTLVRTLNRLEDVTSGTVKFYDKDLAELSPGELRLVRHSISMIFQSFNLLNQRTVVQNVEQPLRIAGVPRSKRRDIALDMLKIVGLEDKWNVFPARLSGGQKQRVAIARAQDHGRDIRSPQEDQQGEKSHDRYHHARDERSREDLRPGSDHR